MIKVGMVRPRLPQEPGRQRVMLGTAPGRRLRTDAGSRRSRRHRGQHLYFIGPARQESVETILEMAEHKKAGRCRSWSSRAAWFSRVTMSSAGRSRRSTPSSASTTSNGSPRRACSKRDRAFEASRAAARYLYSHQTPRILSTPGYSAYVKISEGCDHTCSFCAIPSFRGLQRSRPIDSVVEEARHLAAQGVVEINLIAQTRPTTVRISATIPPPRGCSRPRSRGGDPLDPRPLRLPNRITSEFIEAIASGRRIARYLRSPSAARRRRHAQGVCPGGQRLHASEAADRAPERVPESPLRTTLIVGFPAKRRTRSRLSAVCRAGRARSSGCVQYSEEGKGRPPLAPDDIPSGREGSAARADGHPGGDRGAAGTGPPRAHGSRCWSRVRTRKRPESCPARTEGQAPGHRCCVLITDARAAESRRLRAGPHHRDARHDLVGEASRRACAQCRAVTVAARS